MFSKQHLQNLNKHMGVVVGPASKMQLTNRYMHQFDIVRAEL
jgi:hypothetical protein